MTLRTKSIVFTALFTVISVVACYLLLSHYLYNRFEKVEEDELQHKLEHVFYILEEELSSMEMIALNYSVWDDSVDFVDRAIPDSSNLQDPHIQSNYIATTFTTNKFDYIALLNNSNQLVYHQSYDYTAQELRPLPETIRSAWLDEAASLLSFASIHDAKKGLLPTPEGPLLTVSVPIINSSGQGPIAGTLIIGKYASQETIDRLSKKAGNRLSLVQLTSEEAEQLRPIYREPYRKHINRPSSDEAHVSALYPDLSETRLFKLTLMTDRTIVQYEKETIRYLTIVLLTLTVLLSAGLIWLGDRFIHRRISRLSSEASIIASSRDLSLRVKQTQPDEFGKLETAFNAMLESLEHADKALREQVLHDSLTRLPSRASFFAYMEAKLLEAAAMGRKLAVLFVDLNNFKWVNDTWGHEAGDMLLQEVGKRIGAQLKTDEIVSRLGGDEFTVLLTDVNSREEAYERVQHIQGSLSEPFRIRNVQVYATAAIGVSLYPADGESPEELVNYADASMHHAKNGLSGAQSTLGGAAGQKKIIDRRMMLEKQLLDGIAKQQFALYYQPIVDSADRRVVRIEALLRWRHPELGVISPAEFIPLAEANRSIIELGSWALREACKETVALHAAGFTGLQAAVNISVIQLEHDRFVDDVVRILQETGMPPGLLELEITESAMMSHGRAPDALRKLIELGLQISLDDFGTGYSSLSYLNLLPIHAIKIDRSFVSGMDGTGGGRHTLIASTLIQLGSSLGLKVTAEGVEHESQFTQLVEAGCDEIQGYLISKPCSFEDLVLFLRDAVNGVCPPPHEKV